MSYNAPARNPTPAPRLITIHPTPMAPGANSVLPAAPVMFMPAIAVPVAVVMLMPLMPLIPLIPLIALMTLPSDMVIEAAALPASLDAPLVAAAPAVGLLSHIMVTTMPDAEEVADGALVTLDCARARGAAARRVAARVLKCILLDLCGSCDLCSSLVD